MYRQLGLEDLGAILSCRRDFALMDGFNPELTYSRTQTLMEGADRCDVRITQKPADPAKE
jgi:predicted ArsR family transcriptional regulator